MPIWWPVPTLHGKSHRRPDDCGTHDRSEIACRGITRNMPKGLNPGQCLGSQRFHKTIDCIPVSLGFFNDREQRLRYLYHAALFARQNNSLSSRFKGYRKKGGHDNDQSGQLPKHRIVGVDHSSGNSGGERCAARPAAGADSGRQPPVTGQDQSRRPVVP